MAKAVVECAGNGRRFYDPTEEGFEAEITRRMREWERQLAGRRTESKEGS